MQVLTTSAGQLESRTPYGVLRRLFDRPLMAFAGPAREALADGPARLAQEHMLGVDTPPVEGGAREVDIRHHIRRRSPTPRTAHN